MKPVPVIAIFDVGKTNKKLLLFDEQYKVVWEQTIQFLEIKDEDGDPCEDIDSLSHWIIDSLSGLIQSPGFEVKAINFSAYGASFVHINDLGKVIIPLYNYLKPYPEDLKKEFYRKYGGEAELSLKAASPVLGSLNSGMLLYRLKYRNPTFFKAINCSLHLPQYLAFLLNAKICSDMTSIGCHTNLWDFSKNDYQDWVYREKIVEKLAPIIPSDSVVKISLMGKVCMAGIGLHDSSAALIPYLISVKKPFVLISTGTWCISLAPFNRKVLTKDELKNDCLCYLSYLGLPVKAARLFSGQEHEEQVKRLAAHFNVSFQAYKTIRYNTEILLELETEDKQVVGFSKRNLSTYASYEEAYHRLISDIVAQQIKSTNLVLAGGNVDKIFVDGGFSKNSIYMNLLAKAYPDKEIFTATVSQASALGAALVIHKYWNTENIPEDLIQYRRVVSE